MTIVIRALRSASLAVLSVLAFGQSAPAVRPFEVASVRLREKPGVYAGISTSGRRLTAEAKTITGLIMFAWDLKSYQVPSAPVLLPFGDSFYDIAASAEGEIPPTEAEFRQMLRLLLADRFGLRVHNETRDLPVYELVVGRGGPKFKPSDPHSGAPEHYAAKGRNWEVTMPNATMADVIRAIENSILDRPVIDKTGITGTYDISLTYTPATPPNRKAPDPDDISVFTAVQEQLGLRLESQKASVKVLIVDHVEKPSAN